MSLLVLYTNKASTGFGIVTLSLILASETRGMSNPLLGATTSNTAAWLGVVVPIPTFPFCALASSITPENSIESKTRFK
ncbi:hypothetical protein D3C80_1016500 [compost metagenome]